jgi:hypothetical protein
MRPTAAGHNPTFAGVFPQGSELIAGVQGAILVAIDV